MGASVVGKRGCMEGSTFWDALGLITEAFLAWSSQKASWSLVEETWEKLQAGDGPSAPLRGKKKILTKRVKKTGRRLSNKGGGGLCPHKQWTGGKSWGLGGGVQGLVECKRETKKRELRKRWRFSEKQETGGERLHKGRGEEVAWTFRMVKNSLTVRGTKVG